MPATQPDGTSYDNVVNCLLDGFVGRLDSNGWGGATNALPVNADGRWWWHIVGQGWAADEFLAFHHQGGLPWPQRPDLANAGLMAYIGRDNGIWLMNADGSNARAIVAGGPNHWIYTLQWSPDGSRLAFSVGRSDGTTLTRVADINGTVVAEFPGLSEPRWSPGGGRLSGVRSSPGGVSGYQATPVVLDLTTGAEWAIGPATYGYPAPVWSPDGDSLAVVCTSGYASQPDGSMAIAEGANCYGDGLRVVSADGSSARIVLPTSPQSGWYLSAPSWSPFGGTIAVTSMQQSGCLGYALVDVASGTTTGCVTPPGMGSLVVGGCGGPGMSAPSWTVDRRLVFSAPGAGQSGISVQNPATGDRSFIPGMSTGQVSVAPDGVNLAYDSGGFIWVAGVDGSNLTLLAEGHSPVWQPQP